MLRILISTLVLFIAFNSQSQVLVPLGLTKAYHGVSDGFTLFAPLINTNVYLINNCGELMHTWDSGTKFMGNSVELLNDGTLLKTSRENPSPATLIDGGGGGQFVELIDWDGTVLWQYEYYGDDVRMHHDAEILPNGNILILAWDLHNYNDCIDSGRDPNFLPDSVIWSEHIIEVDPATDQIVWEWWLWDHLIQDFDAGKNNFGVVGDHPELMDINFHGLASNVGLDDWIHANSIDYNEELDQIVMNSRHTGEFYIIDHSTTSQEAAGHVGGTSNMGGDILYRWGNPWAYDQVSGMDLKLYGAHDVHWIPDSLEGPNKILLFNNGWQRPVNDPWSNVMKLELPWNATTNTYDYTPGTTYEPSGYYWDYSDTVNTTAHGIDFYSGYISGAEAIYNGNTLICDGAYGRIFEIDSSKNVVWEYYNPIVQGAILNQGDSLQPFVLGTNNPVFRAKKYRRDYAAFDGKSFNGTALPIEGNFPIPYECAGFASITKIEEGSLSVYPNPASNSLTIESKEAVYGEAVICNALGQTMLRFELIGQKTAVDLSELESGAYYVVVDGMKTIKVHIIN